MKTLGEIQVTTVRASGSVMITGILPGEPTGSVNAGMIYYDATAQKLMTTENGGSPQKVGGMVFDVAYNAYLH